MARKITEKQVISSLIATIILIWVLTLLFEGLLKTISCPEHFIEPLSLLMGIIIPGAAEIFGIILPYIKQFSKKN